MLSAIWAAAVLPMTGHAYSPHVAMAASIFGFLVAFAYRRSWSRRDYDLGPLNLGLLLFGVMAVVSALFAAIDAFLSQDARQAAMDLPIAELLDLQLFLKQVLPGATFGWVVAILTGGLALFALALLLLRRQAAAIYVAKGSGSLASITGIVGIVITCVSGFSFVAGPAGATVIAAADAVVAETLSNVRKDIDDLDTGLRILVGENLVAQLLDEPIAALPADARPEDCRVDKADLASCTIEGFSTTLDSEDAQRIAEEEYIGENGGTVPPAGGPYGFDPSPPSLPKWPVDLRPYANYSAMQIQRTSAAFCTPSACASWPKAPLQPTAVRQVFRAIIGAALSAGGTALPPEVLTRWSGPFLGRIAEEFGTEAFRKTVGTWVETRAVAAIGQCAGGASCVPKVSVGDDFRQLATRAKVHLAGIAQNLSTRLATVRNRIAELAPSRAEAEAKVQAVKAEAKLLEQARQQHAVAWRTAAKQAGVPTDQAELTKRQTTMSRFQLELETASLNAGPGTAQEIVDPWVMCQTIQLPSRRVISERVTRQSECTDVLGGIFGGLKF